MKDKHPHATVGAFWPVIPEEFIDELDMNLPGPKKIVHETDPKTGVGPRCLYPYHMKWLFEGTSRTPKPK